jgi:hypothetical protein
VKIFLGLTSHAGQFSELKKNIGCKEIQANFFPPFLQDCFFGQKPLKSNI